MTLRYPLDDEALTVAMERIRDMADPAAVGEGITLEDQAAFRVVLAAWELCFGEEKR